MKEVIEDNEDKIDGLQFHLISTKWEVIAHLKPRHMQLEIQILT
jgi:hypothetical protein